MRNVIDTIRSAVEAAVARLGIAHELAEHRAMDIWNTRLAKAFPVSSRALFVRAGVLHVVVEEPAWAQELTLIKRELASRINAQLGWAQGISDIRFRTGSISQMEKPSVKPQIESAQALIPNEDDLARAEEISACIGDPEIRKRFRDLLILEICRKSRLAASGSMPCTLCGTYADKGFLCSVCASAFSCQTVDELTDLLRREPWLSSEDIRAVYPRSTSLEIKAAKARVERELWSQVVDMIEAGASLTADGRKGLRLLVESCVSLITGVSVEKVDRELVSRTMGETYAALI